MRSGFKLSGKLKLIVIRKGKKVLERTYKNIIVNAGIAKIAGLIGNIVSGGWTYVAIGTGTTSESASDTALGNEYARVSASVTRKTTNVTNDTVEYDAVFNITSSVTISEAGIFDAGSGGTLLARRTFSGLPLEAGDQLRIIWDIVVSR